MAHVPLAGHLKSHTGAVAVPTLFVSVSRKTKPVYTCYSGTIAGREKGIFLSSLANILTRICVTKVLDRKGKTDRTVCFMVDGTDIEFLRMRRSFMRDGVTLGVVAKHNVLVSHQIPHLVSTLLASDVSVVKNFSTLVVI